MGAIKSDGGSSDYYKIKIPKDRIGNLPDEFLGDFIKKNESGDYYIETEDIIKYALGNDFDLGNIFKCSVRVHSASKGGGKLGNTNEYEYKKIKYTADKMLRLNKTEID